MRFVINVWEHTLPGTDLGDELVASFCGTWATWQEARAFARSLYPDTIRYRTPVVFIK